MLIYCTRNENTPRDRHVNFRVRFSENEGAREYDMFRRQFKYNLRRRVIYGGKTGFDWNMSLDEARDVMGLVATSVYCKTKTVCKPDVNGSFGNCAGYENDGTLVFWRAKNTVPDGYMLNNGRREQAYTFPKEDESNE